MVTQALLPAPKRIRDLTALNRRDIHKILMSKLTSVDLDPQAPRAAAKLTYSITPQALIVRYDENATGVDGVMHQQSIEATDPNTTYRITVPVEERKSVSYRKEWLSLPEDIRPEKCPRGKTVPLRDEDAEEWAINLLERNNLEPTRLDVSQSHKAPLTLDKKIAYRTISATVPGGPHLDKAIEEGIGHGKNYGLGLIIYTID